MGRVDQEISIEVQKDIYNQLISTPVEVFNGKLPEDFEMPEGSLSTGEFSTLLTMGGKLAHSCESFEEFNECWNAGDWPAVKLTPEEQELLKGGGCIKDTLRIVGAGVRIFTGGPVGIISGGISILRTLNVIR